MARVAIHLIQFAEMLGGDARLGVLGDFIAFTPKQEPAVPRMPLLQAMLLPAAGPGVPQAIPRRPADHLNADDDNELPAQRKRDFVGEMHLRAADRAYREIMRGEDAGLVKFDTETHYITLQGRFISHLASLQQFLAGACPPDVAEQLRSADTRAFCILAFGYHAQKLMGIYRDIVVLGGTTAKFVAKGVQQSASFLKHEPYRVDSIRQFCRNRIAIDPVHKCLDLGENKRLTSRRTVTALEPFY